MYNHIVKNLRPDYIVHGSNWDDPGMNVIKDNIVSCLKEYGGKLVKFHIHTTQQYKKSINK